MPSIQSQPIPDAERLAIARAILIAHAPNAGAALAAVIDSTSTRGTSRTDGTPALKIHCRGQHVATLALWDRGPNAGVVVWCMTLGEITDAEARAVAGSTSVLLRAKPKADRGWPEPAKKRKRGRPRKFPLEEEPS